MNTTPGTPLNSGTPVVSDPSLARYNARICRLKSTIKNLRDAIGSAFRRQLEDGEIPDMDGGDPQTLDLLRELLDVLDQEADATRKEVASNETELLQLREFIEQEIADERRQAWRRETRARIQAGENPNALPMDAEMTFADHFHEVQILLKEIERNGDAASASIPPSSFP